MTPEPLEDLLRSLAPQVLAALLRRYGASQFDICEDAVQESLIAAVQQWPASGRPSDPRAWLVTAARRRLIDQIRSESSRRERERSEAGLLHPLADAPVSHADDSVQVLQLCCHPALTVSAQITLTLRAVAGLTTAQIAHAYLLPEATVAQRISRAKARIRELGAAFPAPFGANDRLEAVLAVVYVMFTEGHTVTAGDSIHDVDLTDEAIHLARMLHAAVPENGEVSGMLALLLLTDARRPARTTSAGRLVPLDEQNRSLWDRRLIDEGVALLEETLPGGGAGPYALQAAIAALHDEAPSTEATDWEQILVLYRLLERRTNNPVVTLNAAVAEAMVHGPDAGLASVDRLLASGRPVDAQRAAAVRAHLLERNGHDGEAIAEYRAAARGTRSTPERDYLDARIRRLEHDQRS
ncbi:sigma factor-like helix-turn-helix DNA-binding protein [Pseudolysinimonas kribbensis]|uniref:RNA polymerase sigma24 factor n=1 Tax=Pseudolysinimonas kribbensis TaxID=433641 RepID=A0ABQ6K2I5_9MICO|nr:sigma-70 family RNA polymerase sigma factor [Pseudolysinimonas kribbensis]GMA93770.1 RNA polymerase sigma24 factor [Pseudolysinimonas kribbensis]